MKKFCLLISVMTILVVCNKVQATELRTVASEPALMPMELQLDHPQEMVNIQLDRFPARYDSASLDSFIRARMDTNHVPGAATWVSKNGQVIWQNCHGYANLEDSIEVVDSTIFMLASLSKTIVGTAIMQLWERNLFDLDDDINGYLPFNVRNPDYPDSAITFEMLMTHTSSIHDQWSILNPLWQPGDPVMPLGEFLHEYLVPGGIYYSIFNFNESALW